MPSFNYKALAAKGGVQSGLIDAGDRSEALRLLERRGLQPVSLQQVSADSAARTKEKAAKKKVAPKAKPTVQAKSDSADSSGQLKLKRPEVVLFTEELSDMLSAGLQLEPALKAMENRQELGGLKEVAQRIRNEVRDGTNFSVALKRVSPSFGPLYCSLAAAGEASGALDTILKRQAHYLKTLAELQSRLILAMIYPAFLVCAGIGVSVVFVTVLIPQLTQLIESAPGGKLPLPIQVLVNVSDHLGAYWYVYLILLVAGGLFFKAWKDNEENRPTWDRVKLTLPLAGPVISSRFFVQFLETMANLVGNGLPLLRALELARDATLNLSLRGALNEVIDQVGDGRALSKAMVRTGKFPALLIDMVSVGEQTGKIDLSMRRAAERYDKELNKDLNRIMALIMPTILIIMALMIGTMAYLMINAIFQTIGNLSGRH
ncbi:type II secretory pathway component PulF [Haloferula luteola]|uniref:Type II secretory pathway component PulF n=1 Tax=Haloferula luteola TaxID=595692 RepID=A0A840V5K1_9BACT|nr:type II secretion system F family protein [Haloferula luteola]MBB5352306.1 type II secretory pathway component PulF [Haloferula luteola]